MPATCAAMHSSRSAMSADRKTRSSRSRSSRTATSSCGSTRNGPWRRSRGAMPADSPRLARQREMEVWIARVRLVAVLLGVVEVGLLTKNYPSGYGRYAWITTAVFALGALLLFVASNRADPRVVGIVALV